MTRVEEKLAHYIDCLEKHIKSLSSKNQTLIIEKMRLEQQLKLLQENKQNETNSIKS